jgi:alcohol dehydrogenase class IV
VAVSQPLTTRWIGLCRHFALDVRTRIRQTRAMAENDKMRNYLIVTDHALDDQPLAATVQRALAAGPCQFYLLVLATPAGTRNRVL